MNPDNLHYGPRAQFLKGYTDDFDPIFNQQSAYPFPMTGGSTGTPPPTGGTSTNATIQHADAKIVYSGNWVDNSQGGLPVHTLASSYSGFAGITFTGTAFAMDWDDYGSVKQEVFIDGVLAATSISDGAHVKKERMGKSGLANGVHHVQIVGRASFFARAWVDTLRCQGTFQAYSGPTTVPAAPKLVGPGDTEENNEAWSYFDADGNPATFGSASGVAASNVYSLFTTNVGWNAIIQFQGTGLSLTHFSHPAYPVDYDVLIDGQKVGKGQPPADGSGFGVCFSTSGLANTVHTLKLVCVRTLPVDLMTVLG